MKDKKTPELENFSSLNEMNSIDLKIFRRASKITNNVEQMMLKSVNLPYKSKTTIKKFPRKTKSILPTINIKSIKDSQKVNVVLTFSISLITIVISIYECDSLFNSNYKLSLTDNILRSFLIFLNIIQVFLIVSYYKNTLKLKVTYKIVSKHSTIMQDKEISRKTLIEIFLCLILLLPYITYQLSFSQINVVQILSIEDIFLAFILLRSFHLYKLYYEFSSFNSLKSRFYCNILRIDDQFKFALRCFLKDKPYLSIIIWFSLSIVLLGYILHIYERGVESSAFTALWNGFWIISYTESTVGYGDISPKTHLGRLFCVISSFFGVFMYSYAVSIFKSSADLDSNELKLFSLLKHNKNVERIMKVNAAILIQRWWVLCMKRKIKINNIKYLHRFNCQLNEFNHIRSKENQEMNPSLIESVEKIGGLPLKKIKALTKILEPSIKSEEKALRLANMYYNSSKQIKLLCRGLRKLMNTKIAHKTHKRAEISHGSLVNKAELKKKQDKAVKNMMEKRIKRISLSNTPFSNINDDDFYSSYRSSIDSKYD